MLKHTKENDKKFEFLMAKYKNDEDSNFEDKEIKFLAEYNLIKFAKKFPGTAEYYMQCIDD